MGFLSTALCCCLGSKVTAFFSLTLQFAVAELRGHDGVARPLEAGWRSGGVQPMWARPLSASCREARRVCISGLAASQRRVLSVRPWSKWAGRVASEATASVL